MKTIEIRKGTKPNDWLKVANMLARKGLSNAEFKDAEIFCKLPEPGRCFVKLPGDENFTAYA